MIAVSMPVRAFSFYPLRFSFRAIDPLYFPPGKSANILRGAFGLIFKRVAGPECYARIFEPTAIFDHSASDHITSDHTTSDLTTAHRLLLSRDREGVVLSPSGLANHPRPFVFRASHLDGRHIAPNENFHFDLNLFDLHPTTIPLFTQTFAELAREGIGPGRGRAELIGDPVSQLTTLDLTPATNPTDKIQIDFLTPTELKSGDGLATEPSFGILFARIRDRISTLSTLYGAGPLDIDFKAMGDRAALIRMTRCDVKHQSVSRRSSRTGQTHPIGGFTGSADYEGDLREFLPFLEAAVFTGVGRQTTWGKGYLRVEVYP
jgi:hypothetical protein